MKTLFAFVLILLSFSSCKKTVEKVAEDAIVKIMVTGQWKVSKYTKGGIEVTADFSPYSFQFRENRTVEAIKSGSLEKTGTWEGNATDLSAPTIYSNFTSAIYPLTLLNGTFLVTKTSQIYVEAKKTVSGEEHFIRLDKI